MRRDVTELLLRWSDGQTDALHELMPLVYGELRQIAKARMARERNAHTLQPTALANEAFLRLCDQSRVRWQNRAHFFALASEMMRRVLVEHARKRLAAKRGGGIAMTTLDEALAVKGGDARDVDLLDLDDALERLQELDARQARIVELRYFGGLDVDEVAEVLSISPATIKRDWSTARRWLHRELRH